MFNLSYVNPKYYGKMFAYKDPESEEPSDETPVTPVKKKFSPGPTIASRLRSMFGNKKQTVATALDGDAPSGSSGGMLILYPYSVDGNIVAFLDKDHQHRFGSFEEALNAVKKASMVAFVTNTDSEGNYSFLIETDREPATGELVGYCINTNTSPLSTVAVSLYYNEDA